MGRKEFLSAGVLALFLLAACHVTHVPGAVPPAATGRDGYLKFDSDLPGLDPKVFAKNLLYGDNAYPGYQTFNETGEEFYYAVTDREWQSSRIRHVSAKNPSRIDTLLLTNDKWEGEPIITYDGSRMFFTAILPPTDQPWQSDIYYLDKTATGWSAPHLLPPPVNSLSSEWHASLTRTGVLYFGSERDGGRLQADIFRAAPENGAYPKVEKLPSPINTEFNDCDPLIAPDESWLIFHSNRPGGYGEHDLYIGFRDQHGRWSAQKHGTAHQHTRMGNGSLAFARRQIPVLHAKKGVPDGRSFADPLGFDRDRRAVPAPQPVSEWPLARSYCLPIKDAILSYWKAAGAA